MSHFTVAELVFLVSFVQICPFLSIFTSGRLPHCVSGGGGRGYFAFSHRCICDLPFCLIWKYLTPAYAMWSYLHGTGASQNLEHVEGLWYVFCVDMGVPADGTQLDGMMTLFKLWELTACLEEISTFYSNPLPCLKPVVSMSVCFWSVWSAGISWSVVCHSKLAI